MTNPNEELLTWAVENITTWNDDYTHLRSDCSVNPFYTKECARSSWMAEYGRWGTSALVTTGLFHELEAEFSTKTPQVITKQEWETAKLREQFGRDIVLVETPSTTSCKPQEGLNEVQVGHIHAKLMAEYAEVAKTNPEPWREFEKGILDDNGELEWVSMTLLDAFESWHKYRRKPSPPKTMNIGGIIVEAWPVSEPETGVVYFEVIKHYGEFGALPIQAWRFAEGTFQDRVLKADYIFSTEEQAQAVADALNKLYNDALVGWKQQ